MLKIGICKAARKPYIIAKECQSDATITVAERVHVIALMELEPEGTPFLELQIDMALVHTHDKHENSIHPGIIF